MKALNVIRELKQRAVLQCDTYNEVTRAQALCVMGKMHRCF